MLFILLQVYRKCSSAVAFQRLFKFPLLCIYLSKHPWMSYFEQTCLPHHVISQRLPCRCSQNMFNLQSKPTLLLSTKTSYKQYIQYFSIFLGNLKESSFTQGASSSHYFNNRYTSVNINVMAPSIEQELKSSRSNRSKGNL